MSRSLSYLAVVALVFGIMGPASAGELKSQPKTSANKTKNAQGYVVTGVRHSGSLQAGRKPKEIVVVGGKAKKSQGGKTTSIDDWSDPQ